MNQKLLFIHIPKTAGTSFRLAAKKYFGDENTFFDYGPKVNETSDIIKQYSYNKPDMFLLSEELSKHTKLFLSGHIQAAKYAPLFDTLNTISFVRNPIEQVLSHYKHFITSHNYKESLESFIQEKRFQNIQSRMLAGRDLELYGFIGLTEEYEKSIKFINSYYDIDLEVMKENVRDIKELSREEVDDEIISLIKSLNREDIKLYNRIKKIFFKRMQLFEDNKPYTHLVIQKFDIKEIKGFVFEKDQIDPLNIEIYKNRELLDTIEAKNYREGLLKHSLPRQNFVGFDYLFSEELKDNDKVAIKVNAFTQKEFIISKV